MDTETIMKIYIQKKTIRKSRKGLIPVLYEIPDQVYTVRALLEELCRAEAERRQSHDPDKMILFTEEEMDRMAESGRIGLNPDMAAKIDIPKAQAAAVQAYEDGLVRIFQGEEELGSPDDPVELKENDVLTLVKLSFLSGRLW